VQKRNHRSKKRTTPLTREKKEIEAGVEFEMRSQEPGSRTEKKKKISGGSLVVKKRASLRS